ncbi:MAG: putative Ig domain-containing protein [Planctomycetota bacterium]
MAPPKKKNRQRTQLIITSGVMAAIATVAIVGYLVATSGGEDPRVDNQAAKPTPANSTPKREPPPPDDDPPPAGPQLVDDDGRTLGIVPVVLNNSYFFYATAFDPDGDALTYRIANGTGIDGMTMDAGRGILRWEPGIDVADFIGTHEIGIQATDGYDDWVTQTLHLNITTDFADNTRPLLSSSPPTESVLAGESFSYQVVGTDPDGDAVKFLLVDAPAGMTIDTQTGLIQWVPGLEMLWRDFSPTVYVVDEHGASASQEFLLSVNRNVIRTNRAPSIDSTPPADSVVALPYIYDLSASDPDGDELTYALVAGPSGANFVKNADGSNSSTLAWIPQPGDEGDHRFVVRVSDPQHRFELQSFDVSTVNLNEPPRVVSSPDEQQAILHRPWIYQLEATDPNGDAISYEFVEGYQPAGMELVQVPGSDGQLQWQVHWTATEQPLKSVQGTLNPLGFAHVRLLAMDGRGGIDQHGFYIPVNENHAPVFIETPPENLSPGPGQVDLWDAVTEGSSYQFPVIVIDPNHDVLEVTVEGTATTLPGAELEHLDLDGDGRTELVLTSDVIAVGTTDEYRVHLIASDGPYADAPRLSTDLVFDVVVTPIPSTEPWFTSTPPWPAQYRKEWRYVLNAVDPDQGSGAAPTFSLNHDVAPAGLLLNGNVLTWTPNTVDDIINGADIQLTVTDPAGETGTQNFVLPVSTQNIQNRPPVVTSNPVGPAYIGMQFDNVEDPDDGLWTVNVDATDPDGDRLEFNFNNAPAGMTLDPVTGEITWLPAAPGNYRVQILVEDGLGFTSHAFHLPSTRLNHPPQILGTPWEPTIVGVPWRYELLAQDPDGDVLKWFLDVDTSLSPGGKTAQELGMAIITEPDTSGSLRRYLEWTPTEAFESNAADHFIKLTVSDGRGGVANDEIGGAWDIEAPDHLYVASTPTNSAYAGETWTYQIAAVDPADANATFTFTPHGSQNHPGFSVDPNTGLVTFHSTTSDIGSPPAHFEVLIVSSASTGPQDNLEYKLDVSVSQPINTNPTFATTPSANRIADVLPARPSAQAHVGETWTYDLIIADQEGGLTLELDRASYDAGLRFSGQSNTRFVDITPSEVSADGEYAAQLTWTPTADQASRNVVLSVYDSDLPAPNADPDEWMTGETFGFVQQSFMLTVTAPQAAGAPTIHSLPPATATIGRQKQFQIVATNSNGTTDGLIYSVHSSTSEVNNALTVNADGLVTWNAKDLYNAPIEIVVTDAAGQVTRQAWHASQVNLYRLNEPPMIAPIKPGPAVRDLPFRFQVNASDINNDELAYELFDADGQSLTNGMQIDPSTGVITWTPDKGDELGMQYQVRVTEVVVGEEIPLSTTESFRLRVLNNAPPRVPDFHRLVASVDTTLTADLTNLADQASVIDPNGDTLTFALAMDSPPAGLSISDAGVISWTPSLMHHGLHDILFTVTDGEATVHGDFEIQVLRDLDFQPVIHSGLPRNSIAAGLDFVHQVIASDPDGDLLFYELVPGHPAGMSISNQGVIAWKPTTADITGSGQAPYTFQVRVISDPSRDNLATLSPIYELVVTDGLLNHAPEITSEPMRSATIGYEYVYPIVASDSDNDSLVYRVTTGPEDLSVGQDGVLRWNRVLSNSDLGSHPVTIEVSDPFGWTDSQAFEITVRSSNLHPIVNATLPSLWPNNAAFDATVDANDPDQGVLQYHFVVNDHLVTSTASPALTIDQNTGHIISTGSLTAGDYTFTIRVSDDRNATDELTHQLRVYDPVVNAPPTFEEPLPSRVAIVGQPYSIQVSASDAQTATNDLTYGMEAGPLQPSPGAPRQFDWVGSTPTVTDIGNHEVALLVSDGEFTVRHAYDLIVRENSLPVIRGLSDQTLGFREEWQLPIQITDADPDDQVDFSLSVVSGPFAGDIALGDDGLIAWDTSTSAGPGTYVFEVVASDSYLGELLSTTSQQFTITLADDTAAPTGSIRSSEAIVQGVEATLIIEVDDNVKIDSISPVKISRDGQVIASAIALSSDIRSENGKKAIALAGYTFADRTTGTGLPYQIEVDVTDVTGLSTTLAADLHVEPNGIPPVVSLTIPHGHVVTAPEVLIGAVYNPEDADQGGVFYRLTATRDDGQGDEILIASNEVTATPEFTSDALGVFDTTLLDNGAYTLMLTGWDSEGNTSRVYYPVTVDGRLKTGAFSLAQTDLEIPTPGIPLQINRSYSSTRADQGLDFGQGWKLEFGNPEYDIQFAHGALVGNGGRPLLAGSRVIITLPDGTQEGFTFTPVKTFLDGYGFGFNETYRPAFIPDAGATSRLFVEQGINLIRFGGGDEYVSVSNDASNNLSYNPQHPVFGGYFEVQLRDGTIYGMDITGRTNDVWQRDLNGNQVTYSRDSITHSNGRSIQIVRNGGRITQIIDPAGATIQYDYDPVGLGNLTKVTDRTGRTTEFVHENTDYPHHITGVIDGFGRRTLTNTYDDDGRLVELADADNETAQLAFSSDLKVQETVDEEGNVIATTTFDHRGNPIIEKGPGDRHIIRTFVDDRLTLETQVVGEVDSAENGETDDISTSYSYNEHGEPEVTTNDRGKQQSNSFNPNGSPASLSDEYGNQTQLEYDNNGNVTRVSTTQGSQRFTHDAMGNVTAIYQTVDGQEFLSVTNEYDGFGQLLRTVNTTTGQATEFGYDALGRQTETTRTVTDAEGSVITFTDITVYDAEGRTTRTESLLTRGDTTTVLSVSESFYDANGNLERTLDRRGDDVNGTESTYVSDLRGLQIQTRSQSRGYDPLDPSRLIISHQVSRSLYDADGRAVLTTSFREDAATIPGEFDNTSLGDVSYSHYDIQGRVDRSYRLSGVNIIVEGTAPTLRTRLRVGSDTYAGPPTDYVGTDADHLEAWLLASGATVLSKTSTQYNARGSVGETVDAYGLRTRSTYNRFGEQTESRTEVPLTADFDRPVGTQSAWRVNRTVYDDYGRASVTTNSYLVFVAADGSETIESVVTGTETHYDLQGRAYRNNRLTGINVSLDPNTGETRLESTGIVLGSNVTTFDDNGRVVSTTDDAGLTTDTEYDELGRQVATVGPRRNPSDVEGIEDLLVAPPDGSFLRIRSETEYDDQGRAWKTISNIIVIESADGTVLHTLRDQARWNESAFDAFGNVIRATSVGGDPLGLPHFHDGFFTEYRFNDLGETIAEGRAVDFRYVTEWSESDQSFKVVGWDSNGNGISDQTLSDGDETYPGFLNVGELIPTKLYSHDSSGRLASVSLAAVDDGTGNLQRPVYQYGYDADGNQDLIIDPLGRQTRFTFDELGRQLTRTLPVGVQALADSSAPGTTITPTPDSPFTESFHYDERGRQHLHISFEGIVTESVYDDPADPNNADGSATGRLVQQRYYDVDTYNSGAGIPSEIWAFTYDALGRTRDRVLLTQGASGPVIEQVGGVNFYANRTETSIHDDHGRLWIVATPEGTLEHSYDQDGRHISTAIRAAGVALPSKRGEAWSQPAERVTHYSYDEFGRLSSVIEDDTPADNTDETLDSQYRYHLDGTLGRLELPGNIHEVYDYDKLGRLDVMSNVFVVNGSDGDLLLARYDYDVRADGKRTGLVEEFWFDGSAGQPADGIQQPEELQQTTTEWTYDSLGRLVDEAIDHWDDNFDQTESYTYDLTGNRTKVARLSEAVPDPTTLTDADYDQITAYTYDANDRLLEEVLDDLVDDANDTTTTYGYDHTQQTRKTIHSGLPGQLGNVRSEQSFTYNLQGRMSSAVLETFDSTGALQTRQRSSYEYDQRSFRVGQLVENWNEATGQFDLISDTEFLVTHQNHTGYAQTLRETTTNADGSTKTVDYTFGHDEIAQRVVERDSTGTTTNDTTQVFGHDGHGSVRVLYDLAAAADSLIEAVATYSSYGVLLATHASDGTLSPVTFDLLTSLTYSGEAWDSVLNRGYNRARWYDASSAQWNRLDPFAGNMLDPQSLHKYAYVHGDPIGSTDPTGLAEFSLGGISVNISGANVLRGLGLFAVSYVSASNVIRNIGPTLSEGVAGYEVSGFLEDLYRKYLELWNTRNPVEKRRILVNGHSLRNWDIRDFARGQEVLAAGNTTSPRSVSVYGRPHYAHEVNYFLWGIAHGIAAMDPDTNSHPDTSAFDLGYVINRVHQYRNSVGFLNPLWALSPSSGRTHARAHWARLGYELAESGGDFARFRQEVLSGQIEKWELLSSFGNGQVLPRSESISIWYGTSALDISDREAIAFSINGRGRG